MRYFIQDENNIKRRTSRTKKKSRSSYFIQDENNIKRLNDTSPNGKKRDWKGKHERKDLTAEHMYHAADKYQEPHLHKKAERMEECANVLVFKLTTEGLKLSQAWFCKVRLCPMCNWRRSLKIAFRNRRIVEAANERYKLRWLFLTLTVRNCEGDKLRETVDAMMKAWNRLAGYARVKKAVKGYFRALEITKNRNLHSKWNGTYHPHFHVLLCVTPSYFKGGKYIKHADWVALWKRAMKLDYDPTVRVQVVKPKENVDLEKIEEEVKEAIKEQKAILEVSKYPVKDTDILPADHLTEDGVETAYTLSNAIAYKRLISYGGILKELHKELNLDDAEGEDADLIHVDEDSDDVANTICEVMAYWHVGIKDYVIKGDVIDPETGEIV